MDGADRGPLFVRRTGDLLRGPAVTCAPTATAADLAALVPPGGSAVVVVGADGGPLGIVTDRDLRFKVVAAGRDARSTRAADIMSAPLATVPADALAWEALLEMTRREIHHLAVLDGGRLAGVLASDDVLAAQAVHPVGLARDIARAPSRPALARLAAAITALVQQLIAAGGRAGDVARLVAELNDRIAARVLTLAETALGERGAGAPPMPYCWMVFGSEGRREQTLRTDQDNGLVYADPPPEDAAAVARYFARLSDEAIAGLLEVGFPPCPAGAMASNPRWCQPLATWTHYFHEWMARPNQDNVLAASMYFDLRPVAGHRALGVGLAARARDEASGQHHFLTAMARDVVDRRLPVGLFGRLRLARSGPHRGALDLKGAGGLQLVGAARVHALALGLAETGTIERFQAAGARGLYPSEIVTEIADAHEDLLRLRLAHQLARIRAGLAPDNHVEVRRLSHRDQLLLRESLRTAGRVQAGLRERFATDFAP